MMKTRLSDSHYKKLCVECDLLLKQSDATLMRVSNAWLHIIREHYVFLDSYMDLFVEFDLSKFINNIFARYVRYKLSWPINMLRCFKYRMDGKLAVNIDENHVDVLLVSHLLDEEQCDKDTDFYYGVMPYKIMRSGHSCSMIYINHTERSGAYLKKRRAKMGLPGIVLPRICDFGKEFEMYIGLKAESNNLKKNAKKHQDPLRRKIVMRASKEAVSGNSINALRVANQIGDVVGKLQPKMIIVTYEGHAWERVVLALARIHKPDIICVAYQHSALSQLQHGIFRKISSQYDPDIILTAGTIGKDVFKLKSSFSDKSIHVLGTVRHIASEMSRRDNKNSRACLVVPEGLVSECVLLFGFTLRCAKHNPNIKFIWRLHPSIRNSHNHKISKLIKRLPSNIILSDGALEEDFANSRWVLYRGSTAVLGAVLYGVRPIYYEILGEMIIDPLYHVSEWRQAVKNEGEFMFVMESDMSLCEGDKQDGFSKIVEYCKKYYQQMDCGVIENMINEI